MEYDLSPLLVGLEGAPEEHWMIVQEPAGEPAELPLPADVWTRAKYGQHVLLLYHLQKPGDVEEGGELTASIPEVKLVPARLVKVPGNINIDCVEPGGLVLLQSGAPVAGVDTEVVETAGENLHLLAVQCELLTVCHQPARHPLPGEVFIQAFPATQPEGL